jgi:DNA-binding FadR family transcriptional regulator
LHEALRVLQIQGFLDVRRGNRGGTYVTDLSNISIRDNLEDLLRMGKISMGDFTQARLMLEPEVFRLAAPNATKEQLEEMSEVIRESRETKNDGMIKIEKKWLKALKQYFQILGHALPTLFLHGPTGLSS